MATLLRLGRRVINIDLVCEIEDYGDRMRLFYAVSSSDSAGAQQQSYADINGAAVEALRNWLVEHATQLTNEEDENEQIEDEMTERARLIQAAVAPSGNQTPVDDAYYGAARLQQMHGIGSDTEPNPTNNANATEGK